MRREVAAEAKKLASGLYGNGREGLRGQASDGRAAFADRGVGAGAEALEYRWFWRETNLLAISDGDATSKLGDFGAMGPSGTNEIATFCSRRAVAFQDATRDP